jgi:hypothetical protein
MFALRIRRYVMSVGPAEARVTIRLGCYPAELDLYAAADRLINLLRVRGTYHVRLYRPPPVPAALVWCGDGN